MIKGISHLKGWILQSPIGDGVAGSSPSSCKYSFKKKKAWKSRKYRFMKLKSFQDRQALQKKTQWGEPDILHATFSLRYLIIL